MFLRTPLTVVACLLALSSPVWAAPAYTYDFGQPAPAAKATASITTKLTHQGARNKVANSDFSDIFNFMVSSNEVHRSTPLQLQLGHGTPV